MWKFTVFTALFLLVSINRNYSLETCETRGCYKVGSSQEYNGTWSQTTSGLECQRWDKMYPHQHSQNAENLPEGNLCKAKNYCRDPYYAGFPWCYTMSPDVRWEPCDIPVCTETPKPSTNPPRGCYKSGSSQKYNGTWSQTTSGLECQRWDKSYPHEHSRNAENFPEGNLCKAKNYCRDPGYAGFPWCYTMSPDVRWEPCDIPVCTETPSPYPRGEYDCYNNTETEILSGKSDKEICEINEYRYFAKCNPPPGCEKCERCCQRKDCIDYWKAPRDYTGTWHRTVSGLQCQRWNSQSPHNHENYQSYKFPDASTDDAVNYCRDPDNTGYLWCYTVDPSVRWESCEMYC